MADGGTFREFAAQLEPLLESKGWLGKRLIVTRTPANCTAGS
ncbi:hypothetical protein [Escherichia coli]